VTTAGAKSFHEEGFTDTAFARRGKSSFGPGVDEDDDDEDEEEEEEEEEEKEAIRRAESEQHWDIPGARAFLSTLDSRVASRCVHKLLPHIVRAWPTAEAARFLWEMADRDVLAFAVLLDARGEAGLARGETFRCVLADIAALADAIAYVAKLERLQPRETGRMLRACSRAWNIEPDATVMAPIVAALTAAMTPQRAATLIRELILEMDDDDDDDKGKEDSLLEWSTELAGFFHEATKAWTETRRHKFAEVVATKWGWPPETNAALVAALSPPYIPPPSAAPAAAAVAATVDADEGEQARNPSSPKRTEAPPIPEPKTKRRMSAADATAPMRDDSPSPVPPPAPAPTSSHQKKAAAKKAAKRAHQQQQQRKQGPVPMEEDDCEGEGDSDEEFISIEELAELFHAMGGGTFAPQQQPPPGGRSGGSPRGGRGGKKKKPHRRSGRR